MLSEVFTASSRRVDKDSTLTREERVAEREALVQELQKEGKREVAGGAAAGLGSAGAEDDSDDDEGGKLSTNYSGPKMHLGWDGKPIPHWLYKLHGLNVEYKCEICGGETYYGRRNFDRHFQEWKHAGGMRALGIPNTKHFHDVTRIADARALYDKLKKELGTAAWAVRQEEEEEFEDSMGNVLNRRTYEDLAKQGLL